MNKSHTPGPWQLFHMPFSDSDNGIDLKGNNGNTLIANFPTPVKTEGVAYIPSDEDAANLLLIAAAPELLAALESLLEEWTTRTAHIESCDLTVEEEAAEDAARLAIAKAKGQ